MLLSLLTGNLLRALQKGNEGKEAEIYRVSLEMQLSDTMVTASHVFFFPKEKIDSHESCTDCAERISITAMQTFTVQRLCVSYSFLLYPAVRRVPA